MLSKPPSSPPRHWAVAGASWVPSTSWTVALYSAVFRRWTPLAPGSTGMVDETEGSGICVGSSGLAGSPGPPFEPSMTPVQARALRPRASTPMGDRWAFVRRGLLHMDEVMSGYGALYQSQYSSQRRFLDEVWRF